MTVSMHDFISVHVSYDLEYLLNPPYFLHSIAVD